MKITAVVTDGEDGWLVAEVPALPGCVTQAKTVEDLKSNLREAITGWIEVQNDKTTLIARETVEVDV